MNDEVIVLSPEDSALDAFCLCHRTRLWVLQEAIERMHPSPEKRELERRLNRLRNAFNSKNLDAAEGWLNATLDGIKAVATWLPKTKGKLASENALLENQPLSALALKDKARFKQDLLRQNVEAYFNRNHRALKNGAAACRDSLQSRGELVYSASYALKKIGEIFEERRHGKQESKKAR